MKWTGEALNPTTIPSLRSSERHSGAANLSRMRRHHTATYSIGTMIMRTSSTRSQQHANAHPKSFLTVYAYVHTSESVASQELVLRTRCRRPRLFSTTCDTTAKNTSLPGVPKSACLFPDSDYHIMQRRHVSDYVRKKHFSPPPRIRSVAAGFSTQIGAARLS